jgi:hypothetical protein
MQVTFGVVNSDGSVTTSAAEFLRELAKQIDAGELPVDEVIVIATRSGDHVDDLYCGMSHTVSDERLYTKLGLLQQIALQRISGQ